MKSIRRYLPAFVSFIIVVTVMMPVWTQGNWGSVGWTVFAAALAAYVGHVGWPASGGIDHPVYLMLMMAIIEYGTLVSTVTNAGMGSVRSSILRIGMLFLVGAAMCAYVFSMKKRTVMEQQSGGMA